MILSIVHDEARSDKREDGRRISKGEIIQIIRRAECFTSDLLLMRLASHDIGGSMATHIVDADTKFRETPAGMKYFVMSEVDD